MAKKEPIKLSDQLRKAIDDCGLTKYRIAQDTGINEAALGKFYHGQRGLSLDSIDRLGEYLGLRVAAGYLNPDKECTAMAKKSAGQKAAETKAKAPVTLKDVDRLIARAYSRLDKTPPDIVLAKRALSHARNQLRKACSLPPLSKQS